MSVAQIDSDLWRLGTMIFGAFLSFLAAWILYRLQDFRKKRLTNEGRLDEVERQIAQIPINTKRLNEIENENKSVTKIEIEKGGFMTTKDHADICAASRQAIAEAVKEQIAALDKTLDLKFENLRLTMLVNGKSKKNKR